MPIGELISDVIGGAADLVGDVVGLVGDAVEWVVDEIIEPVVSGIGDVVEYALDNPIEALATLAVTVAAPYAAPFLGTTATALTGAAKWVIPLASGTQTLVNGGSISDAVKSAAISFAGTYAGKIAGTYINPTIENITSKAISNTKLASTVSNVLGAGTKSATKTFVRTGDLKAASTAFTQSVALGGVNAGLEAATDAVMGNINDTLQKTGFGKEFNDLSSGIKDSIYTSVAAEITGQNLSTQQIVNALDSNGFVTDLINKYVPVASFMDGFIEDAKVRLGKDLSATQIQLLSDAMSASWEKAKEGNPDLTGEAFFGSLQEDAYEELIDTISDPIDAALDNITGNAASAELAAAPLNEAIRKSAEAAANFNELTGQLTERIAEQERLQGVYDDARAQHNANPSQATADAVNTAAAAFNDHTINLNADYPSIKEQLDEYKAQHDKYEPTIEGLQETYDEESKYLISDIEDLDAALKPMLTGVDRITAIALRPGIDENGYREAMGLGPDEDVYGHYLANQKLADNIIAADIAAGYVNMANNNISSDSLPNIPSEITRPTIYGAPKGLTIPDSPDALNIDFTAPKPPVVYSGRGGDPRDYGLTEEEVAEYMADNIAAGVFDTFKTTVSDLYRNFTSGGAEAGAYTVGGFGTFADEIAENMIDAFNVDYSDAEAIFYNSLAVQYDPNLTDDEKAEALAQNTAAYLAAKEKIKAEQGSTVTVFSSYTDPLKKYIMDISDAEEAKISPEMQVRQYNALPAPDTTWEQILSGKAKDRLGRPYGFGDPLATVMSGVQELPDLAVDMALLAITKNPAILGGTVAVTSMAEAGDAAADEIEEALTNARASGELQKTQEFADLVRVFDGDEDAAFERLVDQSMGYAATTGVIGGIGDVVLGKIAGASGGSKLLSTVPVGLQTVVKTGTGGVSGGINEAVEQVPINMAQIDAGLDVDIDSGTGAAFLVGLSSEGTATAGAASLTAITDTVNKIKNGTYSYTMPDGTTVSPEPPSGDQTPLINTVSDNLALFELYTNLLNDLSSWGAIPSDSTQFDAPQLISTLENLGIEDTTFIQNAANTAYGDQVITKYEVDTALGNVQPDFKLDDNAYAVLTGAIPNADAAAIVAAYIDPLYIDADEVKEAAAEEGIELTDEQIDAIVGQKDEAEAVKEIDELGTSEAEARKFFTDLGYEPTDEEVQQYVGSVSESDQQTAIGNYVDPRQVTEAEARKFFEDQGYTPTDEEIVNFIGQGNVNFETNTSERVPTYIDPRQVTEAEARKFFEDQGYDPTDEEVANYAGQGNADFEATAPDRVGSYVDPRQVTDEEAREFFTNLGYDPTDEQVAQFVAQVEETTQSGLIASYVDPRQVTREEVQAIADEEGLTLTDALAATYVGQGVAENYASEKLSEARAEYDPLATTLEEATQFFADTGYTATTEEIAQFVASKTEETQTSAIGSYVDPRQITATEAEEFLSAIGYQPSQEDIAAFTGQVNDENYQTTQKAAIDEFVDPRFFDAGEVRAAYEELGLVNVTQEDVDKFVGQFDPESEDYDATGFEAFQRGELETYAPTATNNIIAAVIGTPAVEDDPNTPEDESKDATGIYAEFEAGKDRDEALDAAINKVAEDLGTTKTDLLDELGLTEDRLNEEIDAVVEDVAGLTEEIGDVETRLTGLIEKNDGDVDAALEELSTALGTTETNILTELGITKGELTESFKTAIGDVETSLGADIDAVADLVGKPAREVTQEDIDFVIDLIAQENVSEELIMQYDVTGDGIIDIGDQALLETALQGEEDVTLADTSMFAPDTGIYGEIDTQTDAITDMITDLNTQITTQQQQENLRDLLSMEQQGLFKGAKTTVSAADPANIDYLYDFNSIFANPSQQGLFASPYSTTTRNKTANQPMAPMPMASGFAKGGQVEDENDMLLRILGGM
tara:strand:- start:4391 stop:10141 length:5751 start_codon:yes stop_codon:yes gene_type:complete